MRLVRTPVRTCVYADSIVGIRSAHALVVRLGGSSLRVDPAGVWFKRCLEVDHCLDSGGRLDYAAGRCEQSRDYQ
jgi:hypothetical protein